jgi:hypothetical protein
MSLSSRAQQMQKVQSEGLELFKKKNADYGDSFANYGPVGVIVRLGDKINRLSSVTQNGVKLVNTESTRDTLIDLHNCAAMAIMLLDEKKLRHRRIDEIKNECPINKIITPFGTRIRKQSFSERRKHRWATAFFNKDNAVKSSESRK